MTTTAGQPEAIRSRQGATQAIVTNSLIMFGAQVAIKIISFSFNVVIIRYLGSEQYGKFAISMAFSGLFAVLSDMGLAPYTVRRIARDQSVIGYLVSNAVALRLVLSVAVTAITSILAWIIGYDGPTRFGIFIASLGLISYAFFGLADAAAMGLERFRLSATINVGLQLVTLALAGLFVFSGGGFLGLLSASVVATLIVAFVALRRLHRDISLRGPLVLDSWPGLVKGSLPFAAVTLALAVSYKADAVILSAYVPVQTVGAYAAAYNLVFAAVTLSHSINLTLYPALTRIYAHDPQGAGRWFRQVLRYLAFISVPVGLFVSVNAQAIVSILYGPRFAEAGPILAILSWVIPLMFLSEYLGYVAIVVDRERLAARANWVSSGVNVAANLALIPVFGVFAAASMTVATEVVLVSQYLPMLRRHGGLAAAGQAVGRPLVAAALLGIALMGLRALHWPIVAVGLIGIGVYFLAAFCLGALGRDEIRLAVDIIGQRVESAVGARQA